MAGPGSVRGAAPKVTQTGPCEAATKKWPGRMAPVGPVAGSPSAALQFGVDPLGSNFSLRLAHKLPATGSTHTINCHGPLASSLQLSDSLSFDIGTGGQRTANVQHRTSNFEHRTQKQRRTTKPAFAQPLGISSLNFEVRCWTFDVRCSIFVVLCAKS